MTILLLSRVNLLSKIFLISLKLNFIWTKICLLMRAVNGKQLQNRWLCTQYTLYTVQVLRKSVRCVIIISSAVCLSKRVLNAVRSSAFSFNFPYPTVSLRSFSSCLRLVPLLPVHSTFPSITCFKDSSYASFDQSREPSFVLLYLGYSFFPWLHVLLLSSHDRSYWCSPSFSSTTFKTLKAFLIYF